MVFIPSVLSCKANRFPYRRRTPAKSPGTTWIRRRTQAATIASHVRGWVFGAVRRTEDGRAKRARRCDGAESTPKTPPHRTERTRPGPPEHGVSYTPRSTGAAPAGTPGGPAPVARRSGPGAAATRARPYPPSPSPPRAPPSLRKVRRPVRQGARAPGPCARRSHALVRLHHRDTGQGELTRRRNPGVPLTTAGSVARTRCRGAASRRALAPSSRPPGNAHPGTAGRSGTPEPHLPAPSG